MVDHEIRADISLQLRDRPIRRVPPPFADYGRRSGASASQRRALLEESAYPEKFATTTVRLIATVRDDDLYRTVKEGSLVAL